MDDDYDKQHLDGCRKVMYAPQSSPCTCRLEFERLATEFEMYRRAHEHSTDPITEEWLKSVGFRWHQFDRQPSKHWLLWLGDAMNGGGFSSFEDIGVELAAGAYNFKRKDDADWFCWLRGDSAHRYHRFIHVRHMLEQREVIRLVEGLTNQDWNPANYLYGSCRTPEAAERIRREDAARLDRRENWLQRQPWSEVEKDDTRGRALPEHMEVAEKARGTDLIAAPDGTGAPGICSRARWGISIQARRYESVTQGGKRRRTSMFAGSRGQDYDCKGCMQNVERNRLMAAHSERIAALTRYLERSATSLPDVGVLLEVEQILKRLEDAGNEFSVTNIVSQRTGKGMLDVVWMGQIAQMSPEKARETAWILVEAAAVAEAEGMLMRFLKERVGLGPDTAAQMLQDFRRYRAEDPGSLVGTDTH